MERNKMIKNICFCPNVRKIPSTRLLDMTCQLQISFEHDYLVNTIIRHTPIHRNTNVTATRGQAWRKMFTATTTSDPKAQSIQYLELYFVPELIWVR